MSKQLPNLLLVLATATAALSGASARRPWREIPVRPGVDSEEFLAFDLDLGSPIESTKGRRLDADFTTELDRLGFHTVKVRNPAHPEVTVPLDEAEGQVLARAVLLPGRTESLPAGRLVDAKLRERAKDADIPLTVKGSRVAAAHLPASTPLNPPTLELLRAAGLTEVTVQSTAGSEEILPISQAAGRVLFGDHLLPANTDGFSVGDPIDDDLADRTAAAGVVVTPTGGKLLATVELPAMLRAASFLDTPTLDTLREVGVAEVPVKRVAPFTWADWAGRWAFLLSILVMTAAVLLKRKEAAGVQDATDQRLDLTTLGRQLTALSTGTDELFVRSPTMDAEAIHGDLEPLLQGPAYVFVEGRLTLRAAAGHSGYAAVMDPFSRGERQLARAWSASVDGHADEARASLSKAVPLLHSALEAFPF